ncbi:hypothetical protein DF157_03900 [Burkholderia cenocepacia]|nr:hypothetical protein DF157_03900 [Burkholderia cenocepacia]RQV47585.1 hypothetical protein DF028_01145 [Burkholderia cenocepacia]RQV49947.1 hypothetical protein DF027_05970 [Burkholderia cenocepacia]RQV83575.1 hypothetical protein DF010_01140 [Burkholderia cenocepacia]
MRRYSKRCSATESLLEVWPTSWWFGALVLGGVGAWGASRWMRCEWRRRVRQTTAARIERAR